MISFVRFSQLPRFTKRIISVTFDFIFISLAYWAAYWTRLNEFHALFGDFRYLLSYGITLFFTLFLFVQVGLYRAILRYMNAKALLTILSSCLLSAAFLIFASYYVNSPLPRTVPIIYASYLILLCGGARYFVRLMLTYVSNNKKENVIIYGAGAAGRELSLLLNKGDEYHPVCFIDDEPSYFKYSVQGLNIYNPSLIEKCIDKYKVKKILLAIPSVPRVRRKEIISSLIQFNVEVLTVPALKEVLTGKYQLDNLKDVDLSELLGREAVLPDEALMSANITNKVVMVTGAGGSIGSELCRQIFTFEPQTLILFESSEFNLYQIDNELNQLKKQKNAKVTIIPLLGNVQSQEKLTNVMLNFSVQSVYHAAAFKHVPLVEYNIIEGINNNVFGTYYAARAALAAKVGSFVLISTDKAVRPTNVMGTTKRLAELALQALANEQIRQKANHTCFSMVRFGNVLGSSGSVIPLFKKQIEQGGPITVTHPEITRYFMTIAEAAQLVIQAGAMAKGGEVFVLDMGEPVKINDLAINLIKLSGLDVKSDANPYGDIAIEYSGLRPGEKLYEELLIGDNVFSTAHERILMAKENSLSLSDFESLLAQLGASSHQDDHAKLIEILLSTPTSYTPSNAISDLLWHQKQKIHAGNLVQFPDKVN